MMKSCTKLKEIYKCGWKKKRENILEKYKYDINNSYIEDDFLYDEVVQMINEDIIVTASLLQHKFNIGYNRASNLIDLLEKRGMLIPKVQGVSETLVFMDKEKED